MPYTQSIENCLADAIGPTGLDAATLDAAVAQTAPTLDRLRAWRRDGGLPLLALPGASEDLLALVPLAARYREEFDDVIVLGTGGSSLGGRCLYALCDAGWGPPPGTPRLHFMDNVDPHGFDALFARLDPMRTGVLAISKSGGTAETLIQTLCCLVWLQAGGATPAGRLTAIAAPADNPLRRLAARHGIQILDHDPALGGRYTVLSLVGMLPALIAGLDAGAVRAGAAEVLDAALGAARPCDSAPALGAALSVALARTRGATATVLMPYADRL
ncbi:MAG: Glucose-6-phosphate isomerase, partial [Alphaproteobacteria bacterium MarineAlpha10_Bin3]